MSRVALPLASLLFALPLSIGSFAQIATRPAVLDTQRLAAPASRCPVGLEVQHLGASSVVETGANAHPQGQFQALKLTVNNPSVKDVASVQVTVHGMSSKWKTVLLAQSPSSPDLARTIDIGLGLKGNAQAVKNLSLSQFTAVTSLDLIAITYADGSTWHAQSTGSCSVTPDALMLVSESR